jgi:putative transcriptional regulator
MKTTGKKEPTRKKEPTVADRIREGLLEAIAFERGQETGAKVDRVLVTSRQAEAEAPPTFERNRIIDLRTRKMGLSQPVFASALNVSPETVRAWEQGKNTPGGPALRLLEIAEARPALILAKVTEKRPFVRTYGTTSSAELSRKQVFAKTAAIGKHMVTSGKSLRVVVKSSKGSTKPIKAAKKK